MTQLFYDPRDDALFQQRGMRNLYWLDDLNARPISDARVGDIGFLFAGARGIDDYEKLVAAAPDIRDRPSERAPLLRLDHVLARIDDRCSSVPGPKTWILQVDEPVGTEIEYPVFVRTAISSWKLGGKISKAHSRQELEEEAFELRRAFGWDQPVLAREWLEIEPSGTTAYGPVPTEVRVWIVDQIPFAWSFHHMHLAPDTTSFPPADDELQAICGYASSIGTAFESRLVCADFVRLTTGEWYFLEAGPGRCAGTAHEFVYKSVASKLIGCRYDGEGDQFGRLF